MLSFEFSAIDLILVIAVIVLLILYVKNSSAKPSTKEERFVGENIPRKKPAMEAANLEIEGKRQLLPRSQKGSPKCPYGFEYPKKLDKAASIPDKCWTCSRIVECFGSNE